MMRAIYCKECKATLHLPPPNETIETYGWKEEDGGFLCDCCVQQKGRINRWVIGKSHSPERLALGLVSGKISILSNAESGALVTLHFSKFGGLDDGFKDKIGNLLNENSDPGYGYSLNGCDSSTIVWIEVDGEVAGFGLFEQSPMSFVAYEFYGGNVLPPYRGRGYGKILMDVRMELVKEAGGNLVMTSSRKPWHVTRSGFVPLDDKYDEDGLMVYWKRL